MILVKGAGGRGRFPPGHAGLVRDRGKSTVASVDLSPLPVLAGPVAATHVLFCHGAHRPARPNREKRARAGWRPASGRHARNRSKGGAVGKNKKGPGRPAGPSFRGCRRATPAALAGVLLSVLGEEALVGLVGTLCHVGDDGADLGDLTDIAFIGRADILGLDLDGLVETAGGKQLLEGG